jgi:hypothetical protein
MAQAEEFAKSSKRSLYTRISAYAWLPPGTYSGPLEKLYSLTRRYENDSGASTASDAGVLAADLSDWFSATRPGSVGALPSGWSDDLGNWSADAWSLAKDCRVPAGAAWGFTTG